MTQQDISIELYNIIWRYCNRTAQNWYEVYNAIERIAHHRGIIGKPMQATGFALIARDVLRIWEGA